MDYRMFHHSKHQKRGSQTDRCNTHIHSLVIVIERGQGRCAREYHTNELQEVNGYVAIAAFGLREGVTGRIPGTIYSQT